ncbi:MAG: GAF domain-containing protein, partial [Chloroflexi bacterium]|nr:GAF domain-containing protein [Chloroflexota bacterium]
MATILIVDDRPTNREFLTTLLGYKGHRLLEAADGAEALELVRVEYPDLVIADILMPTMDGYEFVHQLRADPAIAQTTVIFYTAHYLEREALALAESCGVSHILFKPSEPEEVLRLVDEALGLILPPSDAAAGGVRGEPELESEAAFNREHRRLLTDKLAQKANELNAVNERLAALIELGQQLVLEHNSQRILEEFCHASRTIIGAKYAAIGVLSQDRQELRHFLTSGLNAETAACIGPPPTNRGLIAQLLTEGRPIRMYDLNGDPEATGLAAAPDAPYHPIIHSFLGAPIATPNRLYGWLYLGNKVGAAEFSKEDERVIMTVAAQVAVAYENGRGYEKIQRHAAELEQEIAERKRAEKELKVRLSQQAVVAELGQRALVGLDLILLMDEAVNLVARTLGVGYSQILELQPDSYTLLLRAGTGWQKSYVGQASVTVDTAPLVGYTLYSSSGPVIVEDWQTETRFTPPSLLREHGVVSSVRVVIQGQERSLGVLGADSSRRLAFTEDDIHFLRAVANVLASAIE